MKRFKGISLLLTGFSVLATLVLFAQGTKAQDMKEGGKMGTDYRDFTLVTITGDTTTLNAYHGKVIMIVNTASKCGHTPQYAGLEAMYKKYKDQGFTILGFPANDFLRQEPGDNAQIAQFCTLEYGVTFPMMSKIHVKGKEQTPLFKYLTEDSPFPGKIPWNFNKFLLDRDGNVIGRFDPKVEPEDASLVTAVEKALANGEKKM